MRGSALLWPAIALCVAACGDSGGGKPPSVDDVTPAIRAYLVAEHQRDCLGSLRLDTLTVTEVGGYEKSMGGYPVYARFATTCQQGRNSSTFNGLDPKSRAAAGYVRKTAGGSWEGYMPEVFRQGQLRAKQQLEQLMSRMPTR